MMKISSTDSKFCLVEGDLLTQQVEAIVNPWNRNFIPWWLLLPHGVSGALKQRAGFEPFKQVRREGLLKLGEAVATGAGRLPYRAIIHVAGLNWTWTASEFSIRESTRNALKLAHEMGLSSLALPLIGAGTGGIKPENVIEWMGEEIERHSQLPTVLLVRFPAP